MKEPSRNIRDRVVEHVALLASASDQRQYERDVPIASVPDELICGFTDDLYHPKSQAFLDAFIEEDLQSLAELYGLLCAASKEFAKAERLTLDDILKIPEWRSVMAFAKDLLVDLERNG